MSFIVWRRGDCRLGVQPGYPSSSTTSASTRELTATRVSLVAWSADATELLVLHTISAFVSCVRMTARFVDVSTRPSISGCMLMTPCGRVNRRLINLFWESWVKAVVEGSLSFSIEKAASFSTAAYSSLILWKASSLKSENLSLSDGVSITDAHASRGMAFRKFPPSMETRRKGTSSRETCHKILARSFMALARPWLISMPECPPLNPESLTL